MLIFIIIIYFYKIIATFIKFIFFCMMRIIPYNRIRFNISPILIKCSFCLVGSSEKFKVYVKIPSCRLKTTLCLHLTSDISLYTSSKSILVISNDNLLHTKNEKISLFSLNLLSSDFNLPLRSWYNNLFLASN